VDWQKEVARLVYTLEKGFDWIKYRVGPRLHGRNPLMIMPYLGFGSAKFIELKGRVIEDSGVQPSQESDRIWNNLLNMYRRFESDEVPFARVVARFQDVEQVVDADEEGFFEISLDLQQTLTSEQRWQGVELELLEPKLSENGSVRARGQALIVSPQAEYGVISDIDDTVVYTGVTSRLRMLRTVLLKNARTRLSLAGVADFYNALQQGGSGQMNNPLFYVSSSPWNIYDLFREFFQINSIPAGPIFLRDWGFERQTMLAIKNRKHKLDSICHILDRISDLKFILIGDSGEEDPEIYSQIIQSYPQRILAAYIRSVDRDLKRQNEIRVLAEQAGKSDSILFLAENMQAMAKHAAQQGWISLSSAFQPAD
jgi:phosphatidate phosphatase APP1